VLGRGGSTSLRINSRIESFIQCGSSNRGHRVRSSTNHPIVALTFFPIPFVRVARRYLSKAQLKATPQMTKNRWESSKDFRGFWVQVPVDNKMPMASSSLSRTLSLDHGNVQPTWNTYKCQMPQTISSHVISSRWYLITYRRWTWLIDQGGCSIFTGIVLSLTLKFFGVIGLCSSLIRKGGDV